MNRKRLQTLGLTLVMLAAVLTGCGSAAKPSGDSVMNGEFGTVEEEMAMAPMEDSAAPESTQGSGEGTVQQKPAKLIYRGSLNMETTAFDDAVETLQELIRRCGGYVENSSLHNYGSGYRSAEYVIRVPADQYRTFYTEAGALCHVTWKNEETENVSRYYYDTAGRLETQKTKLTRLQELLSQAENMEDLITIESAISDTEYQIDSLSGELGYYDDLVDYSTVTITLSEVYQLSNTEEPATSFGSRLMSGFSHGFTDFIRSAESALVWIAYHWVAVLLASAVLVGLVRHLRRKKDGKKAGSVRPAFRFRKSNEDQHDPEG